MMPSRRRNPLPIGLLAACAATGLTPAALNAQSSPSRPSPPTAKLDRYGDPLPPGAVLRLGTVKYRQDSPIYRIAYAPDGKHFVTDGDDGRLRVWDAASGRLIRQVDAGVEAISDFALSTKGKIIMVAGIAEEPGRGFVRRVRFIEVDSGLVADEATWDEEVHRIFGVVALCPERQYLAEGLREGMVLILDAMTGAEIRRLVVPGRIVAHLAFTRDGKRIAVTTQGPDLKSNDDDLRIYELDTGKEVRVIRQPNMSGIECAFTPDGTTIATRSDHEIVVWSIASGGRIRYGDSFASRLGFSADGRTLVCAGMVGDVGVFDMASQRRLTALKPDVPLAAEVALSPDGLTVVGSGGANVLHSWDLKTRQDRFAMPDSHTGSVTSMVFSPDGKTLITAGSDHTVRLWDLNSGRQLRVLRCSWYPEGLALSPDGRWLVAPTDYSGQVFVWDLKNDASQKVFTALSSTPGLGQSGAVRILEDNNSVLLAIRGGRLMRWDIKEWRSRDMPHPQLSAPDLPESFRDFHIRQAVFLSGGKRLAALIFLGGLRIVDTSTGTERFRSEFGDLLVSSADERMLAVAGSEEGSGEIKRIGRGMSQAAQAVITHNTRGLISLRDSETGQEKRSIAVRDSQVWAMTFAPDGKTLAVTTGWERGQIHFYDVVSGKETRTIESPPLRSPALAFTPDGSRLVSGMADGSVLVWDIRPAR